MEFTSNTPKRRRGENIVPMINVVFLLLIFFLMSAQIAPPDPFDVELPESKNSTDQRAQNTLFVSLDGTVVFEGARDDAAFAKLSAHDASTPLFLKADSELAAPRLATLLSRLAQAGVKDVRLVTGGL